VRRWPSGRSAPNEWCDRSASSNPTPSREFADIRGGSSSLQRLTLALPAPNCWDVGQTIQEWFDGDTPGLARLRRAHEHLWLGTQLRWQRPCHHGVSVNRAGLCVLVRRILDVTRRRDRTHLTRMHLTKTFCGLFGKNSAYMQYLPKLGTYLGKYALTPRKKYF
jgi:hypothetical protein